MDITQKYQDEKYLNYKLTDEIVKKTERNKILEK